MERPPGQPKGRLKRRMTCTLATALGFLFGYLPVLGAVASHWEKHPDSAESTTLPRQATGTRFVGTWGESDVQESATSQAEQQQPAIPQAHPRIWWTKERLGRATKWYANHPFVPRNEDIWGQGFRYVVAKDKQAAQIVIQKLMAFQISEERLKQVSCDLYRWNDWFPVMFDWTHDAMTSEQRQTLLTRYNHYVDVIRQKKLGGPGMDGNNYYWGYLRNEINWAIATYHENPTAKTFLDHALVTRWQKSFLPYAAGAAKGGVPQEGTQYGRYMLGYPVVPFSTLKLLGRNLFNETNFFKESVFYLIYATTPSPTARKGAKKEPYYQLFPFADDEMDDGYPTTASEYYGDFMTTAAQEWSRLPVGKVARHWLRMVQPPVSKLVAAVDPGGPDRDFSDLPFDYYAPGIQYFYVRNRWGPKATTLFFQLGRPARAGHEHLDMGTFQLWRNGHWLSKESTGYSQQFRGGTTRQTISHNGILFQGIGEANAYWDGPPKVLRLESQPTYAYAVVDLSATYRTHRSGHKDRDDNPYAGQVVREFLFLRPLEALVILDRLEATSEKMPANDVGRTFVVHFPNRPQIERSNLVLGVNGDQALQITTLLPKKPEYDVVDEGDFKGKHLAPSYYQYRLEVKDRGAKQSYFLHVLQCRDARREGAKIQLEESASSWTIRLDQPALGHAVVVFNKGLRSTGGAVGYSAEGMPSNLTPLRKGVQDIEVTDKGPVWKN